MKNNLIRSGIIASLILVLSSMNPAPTGPEIGNQDVDVFPSGEKFIVRGEIDGKTLFTSKEASEAIQYAVNAMAGEGGKISLHRGSFPLNQAVNLKNNVFLEGKGRGTRLIVTPQNAEGTGLQGTTLKGIHLANFSVIHQNRHEGTAGVIIDDSGDCQVRNLHIQGFGKYGIWLRNNSFLCEISGCQLVDNAEANLYCDNLFKDGRGGKFLPNLISDCVIYSGGMGFKLNRTVVMNINDCIVFQTRDVAFHLSNISNSVLISGCRTFQIEKQAVVVKNSHEINISSNIFCWHREEGIVLDRVSWGTITANNIIDSGVRARDGLERTGIVVRNECKGIQVTGNNIFNWGDQMPMLYGIYEDSSSINNQFISNNLNYYTREAVESLGKNTLVKDNLGIGNYSYENFGNPAYPDFDSTLIELFMLD